MNYTIKKAAKTIEFSVETGFIVAFGFAIDPISKSSKAVSRRYTLVLPFLVLEMSIRKIYGK
jgi:hypothetical protein